MIWKLERKKLDKPGKYINSPRRELWVPVGTIRAKKRSEAISKGAGLYPGRAVVLRVSGISSEVRE